MLGLFRQAIKTLRTVDSQLQQVVDLVHPGPVAAAAQQWTPEARTAAARAVQRALDNWYTRHGVHQAWGGATGPRSPGGAAAGGSAAGTLGPAPSASAAAPANLAARLSSAPDRLTQPPYLAPWDPKTVFYPRWMFGEWRVSSKFTAVATPLGARFVPPGFLQVAEAPPEDGGVGSEYSYALRFYSTLPDTFENNMIVNLGLGAPHDAIIADKAFNTKSTSSAFLGYDGAVSAVEWDPRDAPLRQTVTLSSLGPDMAPLPPRRLELYVNALQSEEDLENNVFRTSELARQVLVAVRDVQVTDYEVINEYRRISDGKIAGRQRSLLYLQPQDALFFKAGGHPVAAYDYDVTMEREPAPSDAPYGAVACVLTPKNVNQCV